MRTRRTLGRRAVHPGASRVLARASLWHARVARRTLGRRAVHPGASRVLARASLWHARRTLATITILCGLVVLGVWYHAQIQRFHWVAAVGVPGWLFLSAFAVHVRWPSAQMLARAVWWTTLVTGAAFTLGTGARMPSESALINATACGLALLCAGPTRPVEDSRFAPAAFQTTLVAALVLAMGDMLSLGYFFSLAAEKALTFAGPSLAFDVMISSVGKMLTLGATVAMAVGVLGLLHLRGWALVWNLMVNLTVAALALADQLWVPRFVAWALAATAALQVTLLLPVAYAALSGRPPSGRHHPWLAQGAVVALMVTAIAGKLLR